MKRILMTLFIAALASGCGAVMAWDSMEITSAKKQAAKVLLDDCKAGDKEACAYVAGTGIR